MSFWGSKKIQRSDGSSFNPGTSWLSVIVITCLMSVTAVLFNNCGNEFLLKGGQSDDPSVGSLTVCDNELFRAFSTGVYPLTSSKCASCHSGSGPSNAYFASPDQLGAFRAFQLATMEKLKLYALNPGHVNGITGTQNQATIDAAEAAWNEAQDSVACKGEDGGGGDAAKMTNAKPISATATNRTISWNLDSEIQGGADLAGATFEIQVRQATPTGGAPTYYFSGPIIKTAGSAVEVKGIYIYINNQKYLEGTTYGSIDAFVPAANTTTTLSTGTILKQMPGGIQASDTISISFNHLQRGTIGGPTPTPTPPVVLNGAALYATNCQACHNALAASAKRGRTAAQIRNAINTQPQMQNLTLSDQQLQAIATALQ